MVADLLQRRPTALRLLLCMPRFGCLSTGLGLASAGMSQFATEEDLEACCWTDYSFAAGPSKLQLLA